MKNTLRQRLILLEAKFAPIVNPITYRYGWLTRCQRILRASGISWSPRYRQPVCRISSGVNLKNGRGRCLVPKTTQVSSCA